MTILVKERSEPNQSSSFSNQNSRGNEDANRRFIKSMKRHEEEHAERVRELKRVKNDLPKDKEMLDINRLSSQIYGLNPYVKRPEMTELYEIEYYLDHPEIKTTDQFIKWVIESREKLS